MDDFYGKGLRPKSWNDAEQAKRDRQALIDIIRTGMVQRLEDGTEPKLSKPVRDTVRILVRERGKRLEGVAMRAPKNGTMSRMPSKKRIAEVHREIEEENRIAWEARVRQDRVDAPIVAENRRKSNLPSEHPDHVCGLLCDGQDGVNSYCGGVASVPRGRADDGGVRRS